MAGITYKHVWSFATSAGDTFSETWYRSANNLKEAATLDDSYILPRCGMLHKLNTFQRVRVSQVNPPGRAAQEVLVGKKGQVQDSVSPLVGDNAIICNLVGVDRGTRKWWQRGGRITDYGLNADGSTQVTPAWQTIFNAFMSAMATAGYGMLVIDRNTTKIPITSVDETDGTGYATITTQSPHLFTVGSLVIFGLIDQKQLNDLNGTYQVTAAGVPLLPNVFKVRYRTPGNTLVATAGGYVKAKTYLPFTAFDPARCGLDHFGGHTTRSPFGGSRGARHARRLRNLA